MHRISRRVAALVVILGLAAGFTAAMAPSPAGAADQETAPVTARLVLARARVTAGRTLRGNLVLTNHTNQTVDLTRTCTPKWEVVPGRGRKAPGVAFSQVCGVSAFTVASGSERLSFTISTDHLRAGRYRAFLVASDPEFPTARPVPFTIVKAS